jgi:hypothetical protein
VKELLVADFEEPDVLIVIAEPVVDRVTEPVQMPDENVPVLVGLIVPADADRVLVPV